MKEQMATGVFCWRPSLSRVGSRALVAAFVIVLAGESAQGNDDSVFAVDEKYDNRNWTYRRLPGRFKLIRKSFFPNMIGPK